MLRQRQPSVKTDDTEPAVREQVNDRPDRVMLVLDRGPRHDRTAEQTIVRVRWFRGKVFADLREHYRAEDGTTRPTKRGATIREHELDDVIEALVAARAVMAASALAGLLGEPPPSSLAA